ncbi:hypothetical protein BDZ89DRAFT_1063975 [Hymenopellis radicata]|nr:hypothetical protein BDZ89DRAFT_1063975 [Hymenopellis radicata]
MSVTRTGSSRRQQRNYSPYARPQPKKSGWSLSSIFSIFNPLRSRSDASEDADMQSESGSEPDSTPEPEPQNTQQTTPAHALADVGHRVRVSSSLIHFFPNFIPQMTHNLSINGRSSTSTIITLVLITCWPSTLPFPIASESSPEKNIELVTKFLQDKRNGSISDVERDSLVSLLRSSSRQLQQTNTREPFRFTHSPSPMRGNSPNSPTTSQRHDRSASPTKMLSRNPNGSYRWDGGGSSKKRNRYTSPAFGPRSASEPFVLKPSSTDNTKTDTKRRRVSNPNGDTISQASGSSVTAPKTPRAPTSSRSPGPDPSPTRLANASMLNGNMSPSRSPPTLNGSSSTKSNGLTISTSRMSGRFTTPAVPSPLRQTWGQSSPGSTGSSSPDATPQKQTKAANLMAELIKEATPSNKLEISNPYQAASPARPVIGRPKRPRASGRAKKPVVEEKKEKESVFTAQAIIEATVPKGSKRSRPPSSLPLTNGNSDIEEVEHASKKVKPTLGVRGEPPERVNAPRKDVDMEPPRTESTVKTAVQPPAPVPSPFGLSLSTSRPHFAIPKEPSKLRFSYQPDSSPATTPLPSSSSQPTSEQSQPPAAPATNPFSLPKAPSPPLPVTSSETDPKAAALSAPEKDVPYYDFSRCKVSPAPLSVEDMQARQFALAADVSTLPNGFDFKVGSSSTKVVESSPAPPKSFNWAAAGIKPPTGKWVCSSCHLSHEPPKQAKCPVCEEPQEMPAAEAPKAFNWAGAGLAAPQKSADKWTCGMCGCSSAAAATKCSVCEAPR